MEKQIKKNSKILIIRPDAIGDVVLAIPLINTIKQTFIEPSIYTLQQNYTKPLLDNHPAVKEVLLDWKKQGKVNGLRGFFRYVKYIKSFDFDMVIFSYLDGFYALLCFFAGIPIRLGDKNKVLIRPLLSESVKQSFRNLVGHEVEQNIDLFRQFLKNRGMNININTKMDLYLAGNSNEEIVNILTKNGWQGEMLIGIHPATGGGNRGWLPYKYAQLIDLIHQNTNYKVVLTGGGNKDIKIIDEIISLASTDIISLANKTSLSQLKAVIKKCRVFVGTDTGPTHMAAALGVAVVCVSPTKFVKSLRWGPWQTKNRIIGEPSVCENICNPYKCDLPDCLEAIDATKILLAINEVINEKVVSEKEMMQRNKREWFRSSINILYYLDSEISDKYKNILINYINWLYDNGFRVRVMYKNEALKKKFANLFKDSFEDSVNQKLEHNVFSLFNFFNLIKYIIKKDINFISLVPNKKNIVWWFVVRQFSALKQYSPPLIVGFGKKADDINMLIDEYILEYGQRSFKSEY